MCDKVQDLLFRADFFFESHKQLRTALLKNMPEGAVEKTDYFNSPVAILTILNANLYFFEAVSCVASLLRDSQADPTKNEISFHGLADRLSDMAEGVFQLKVSTIFAEYKASGLKEMRDKYVDHKDLKSSGDPTAAFINLPAERLVDSCSRVIQGLKELYREHFPDAIANNYFSDFYSPGVHLHVQLLSARRPT